MQKFFSAFLFLFLISIGCAQNNPPFIENPIKKDYTYEIIIDGIDVPWGMAFLSKNELLQVESINDLAEAAKKAVLLAK